MIYAVCVTGTCVTWITVRWTHFSMRACRTHAAAVRCWYATAFIKSISTKAWFIIRLFGSTLCVYVDCAPHFSGYDRCLHSPADGNNMLLLFLAWEKCNLSLRWRFENRRLYFRVGRSMSRSKYVLQLSFHPNTDHRAIKRDPDLSDVLLRDSKIQHHARVCLQPWYLPSTCRCFFYWCCVS